MRVVTAIVSVLLGLCASAPGAHAAITCFASVNDVSTSFDPALGANLVGTWTVNCNRASGDPTTYAFSLAANNGLYQTGGGNSPNRVKHTGVASYYQYRTYQSGNTGWGNNNIGDRIQGTVNFPGGALFGSATGTFEVRAAAQAAGPAGTYLDMVAWTLYQGTTNTQLGNGTFNVFFITNPTCSLSPVPNLTFNYTSFQAGPATATSNFTVTCSQYLPYQLALDVTGPVTDLAVNLTYSLVLSATQATGTGGAQAHRIDGTMAGGQSGTCAGAFCTNAASPNKTRTLTITY